MCQQCQSHNRDEVGEAFQGVLATSDIAKKCGDNPFLIHRQPTKTDRKRATICDSDNPFLLSKKSDMLSLCFFTAATSLPGSVTPLWPHRWTITKIRLLSRSRSLVSCCHVMSCPLTNERQVGWQTSNKATSKTPLEGLIHIYSTKAEIEKEIFRYLKKVKLKISHRRKSQLLV